MQIWNYQRYQRIIIIASKHLQKFCWFLEFEGCCSKMKPAPPICILNSKLLAIAKSTTVKFFRKIQSNAWIICMVKTVLTMVNLSIYEVKFLFWPWSKAFWPCRWFKHKKKMSLVASCTFLFENEWFLHYWQLHDISLVAQDPWCTICMPPTMSTYIIIKWKLYLVLSLQFCYQTKNFKWFWGEHLPSSKSYH